MANVRLVIFMVLAVAVSFIVPGLSFSIVMTAFFFYLVSKYSYAKDRRYILALLGAALLLRLLVFIVLQYICFSKESLDIFGDAEDNIIQGFYLGDYFKGAQDLSQSISGLRYNTHGMSFFNGIFFFLFGEDFIALKYLNILFASVSGWLVYDLCGRIYSRKAGRIAATIFLFWPTFLIWSVTDLKESHLIISLLAAFYLVNLSLNEMRTRKRILLNILGALLLLYAVLLKLKLLLPVAALLVVSSLIFYILRNRGTRVAVRFFLASSLAGLLVYMRYKQFILQTIKDMYGTLVNINVGFMNSGGWNYNVIGEKGQDYFTLPFFLKYMVGAWFHFMTEPLPWHLYSMGIFAVFIVMPLWYLLLFSSAIGIIKIRRAGKIAFFFPMLVFTVVYTTIVGMAVANIGTAARFRDVVMPFVVILAACGMTDPSREDAGR